jgi:hypothetical protein
MVRQKDKHRNGEETEREIDREGNRGEKRG